MSPEVLQQIIWPLILAAVGLIVAILGGATAIVRSHAKMVEQTNAAAAAREQAAVAREKLFNSMVTELKADYRREVEKGDEREAKIRELLEKLAELPKLELSIEKLRAQVVALETQLHEVKQAREDRERELKAERELRREAEAKQKELEKALVKEKGERVNEREELNKRIGELTDELRLLESRTATVESKLGTNETPAVTPEVQQ